MEIGTGTTEFEALARDQELQLIAGPQGGHHFFVHARMGGMEPGDPESPGEVENPRTLFAAYDASGTQLDAEFPPYRIGYVQLENGGYELPSGRLLILDPENEAIPGGLYGNPVRLTVRIEDADGQVATDERTVVAAEPPEPPAPDAGMADAGPSDGGS